MFTQADGARHEKEGIFKAGSSMIYAEKRQVMRLRAGNVVAGKYRLLKPLGKGGEGSVWLAIHLQTEQLWAVKEIPRGRDGQEFHELNMLKKLHHPSLARILDVQEETGAVYLIMEYIRGHDLAQIVQRQGRLSPEQVLEAGYQISRVLQYLHGRTSPVYHLDIKPSNIIREKGGRLVLVDFGAAAKPLNPGEEKERRGTKGFAAPEQYDLKGKVDARTDIFGLGATLYFLISGVCYSESLAKSRIPGCPEALGNILMKCVRSDPDERFENSRQLGRSLYRLKKRRAFERKRLQFWGAVLLAAAATGLAWKEVPREFFSRAEEVWNYEKLLEEALCAGKEESDSFYQKAVFLEPGRKEAYLQFLEEAAADACFSVTEEQALRTLLHTIPMGETQTNEEQLAENPEEYGPFAARLGMVYWYDYEAEGGKRIGTGWFRKAGKDRENRKDAPGWAVRSEIFAHMGSYYESLGRATEETDHTAEYWEDLTKLLEQDVMEEENPVTELRFYQEAVNQMIFLAEELRNAGISEERQKNMLRLIRQKTEQASGELSGGKADIDAGEWPEGQGRDTKEELVREILSRIQTAEEILEHEKR
ncbi:MAG: serine/threonine-protein kinase [Lachnospiraceae bacterium]|nr:serine/threonine-protein kinase [Lachnospiraceae bacterium]